MHSTISPAILYWGTPVTLITTVNSDGTYNICPMSSVFWLGHRAVIGLGAGGKTGENLQRTKQCVLNLPSDGMTENVNLLALTTGSNPVPEWKAGIGYQYVKDKFAHAKLTPQVSDLVSPARIKECPVQMEAELIQSHEMMSESPDHKGLVMTYELKIVRVHVEDDIRQEGFQNRIDTDKWHPMFMVFQKLYGMEKGRLAKSRLAQVGEENYRGLTMTTSDEVENVVNEEDSVEG